MNIAITLAALFISEPWYANIPAEIKGKRRRRHALYCRARGIVVHDRVLTGRVKVAP